MSLFPRLDTLDLSALCACFAEESPHGERYADLYFEEVAYLMLDRGGASLLCALLPCLEGSRLCGALHALGGASDEPDSIDHVLVGHLEHPAPTVIAAAISSLARRRSHAAATAVLALHDHPDARVRAAALRYASAVQGRRARPLLLAALADPHYLVRVNAVDELAECSAVEALDAIRRLRRDPHENVRRAAATALPALERARERT